MSGIAISDMARRVLPLAAWQLHAQTAPVEFGQQIRQLVAGRYGPVGADTAGHGVAASHQDEFIAITPVPARTASRLAHLEHRFETGMPHRSQAFPFDDRAGEREFGPATDAYLSHPAVNG
jgi:hypothetical protein